MRLVMTWRSQVSERLTDVAHSCFPGRNLNIGSCLASEMSAGDMVKTGQENPGQQEPSHLKLASGDGAKDPGLSETCLKRQANREACPR